MTDDEIKLELANLRTLIDGNDKRYAEITKAETEARRNALDTNNKRLDGMNEFRAAMSDLSARMLTKDEDETSRASIRDKIDQQRITLEEHIKNEVEPLNAKMAIYSQPNWALMASCISIFIVLVTGVWLVIGLKIESTISPLAEIVAGNKTSIATLDDQFRRLDSVTSSSSQENLVARADRTQINDRMRTMEGIQQSRSQNIADIANLKQNYQLVLERMSTIRSDQAKMSADLIEIETQFCGGDNIRNQIHANDMRFTAMMWKKLFDTTMPTDNSFYAQIGKCK